MSHEDTQSSGKGRRTVQSSQYRVIYSNSLELAYGDNDVAVTFCVAGESLGDATIGYREVTVMLTHRSAKLLSHILDAVTRKFEAESGKPVVSKEQLDEIERGLLGNPEPSASDQ